MNEDWRATTFARDKTIATLQKRIRELEAELAQERQLAEAAWRGDAVLLARAEKAEKELYCDSTGHCHRTPPCHAHLIEYYQRETARVAELEKREPPGDFGQRLAERIAHEREADQVWHCIVHDSVGTLVVEVEYRAVIRRKVKGHIEVTPE